MKKDDIRRAIKARKTLLNKEEKLSAAERVFNLLEQTADFMLADRILTVSYTHLTLPTNSRV